jgi:hypothetical protein
MCPIRDRMRVSGSVGGKGSAVPRVDEKLGRLAAGPPEDREEGIP